VADTKVDALMCCSPRPRAVRRLDFLQKHAERCTHDAGTNKNDVGSVAFGSAFGRMEFTGAPLVCALVRSECGARTSNMELLDFNHAD
jgi:hypothetical protein